MAAYYRASSWLFIAAATVICSVRGDSGSGMSLLNDGGEEEINQQESYCPGYTPGNPGLAASVEDCKTGADIGVVDHMRAFGIGSLVKSPNWTACGIPTLPEENERVCYKTSVVQCSDGYHIYLNRRNPQIIQSCINETNDIPLAPPGVRFLKSPRYDCVNNRYFRYRKSEFCLYDISIPDCPSGKVVIDNTLHYTQELEQRHRYFICCDYLQFFTGSTASEKFCGTELSRLRLEIPQTRFQAIFWTDTSINRRGFKLRVSCINHMENI